MNGILLTSPLNSERQVHTMAIEVDSIELPEPNWGNWDLETDPHERRFREMLEESKAVPEGQLEGRLIRWQRGDGYAWYKVVSEEPLELAHVLYSDNWRVEDALIRGLDVDDVRQMVEREQAIARMFGRAK